MLTKASKKPPVSHGHELAKPQTVCKDDNLAAAGPRAVSNGVTSVHHRESLRSAAHMASDLDSCGAATSFL